MNPKAPVILQHCFGAPGKGGPATALARLLEASGQDYPQLWQTTAAGGISTALLRDFTRQMRSAAPDLIHVRGLGNEGFHAVLAARMARVPRILVSVHGTQRDLVAPGNHLRSGIVARILEPLTLRLADNIVTVCEFAAGRDFLRPYAHKMLPPVPNGVQISVPDPEMRRARRAAMGISPDAPVLVCVGRLSVEKGLGDLAEALRRLPPEAPALDMVIVGDGPARTDLEIAFAGIDRVRAHFVGQQAVNSYLQAADIFVFPSWHENLSNALLEAMAADLPVVATAVGGNVEVVEKGGGLLVPARDPAALAEAISRLLRDRDLRNSLGAAALRTAETSYSISRMVGGWEETYRTMLSRKAAR